MKAINRHFFSIEYTEGMEIITCTLKHIKGDITDSRYKLANTPIDIVKKDLQDSVMQMFFDENIKES